MPRYRKQELPEAPSPPLPEIKKQELEDRYSFGHVATATEPVVVDNVDKKQYTQIQALVMILNKLDEIADQVVG